MMSRRDEDDHDQGDEDDGGTEATDPER